MTKITFLYTGDKDGFDRLTPMEVEKKEAKKTFKWLVEHHYYNIVAYDDNNKVVPMALEIGRIEWLGIKIVFDNNGKLYRVSIKYPSGMKELFESHSRAIAEDKFTAFGKDLLMR